MTEVQYSHKLNYCYDGQGNRAPILPVRIVRQTGGDTGIDVDAYLDTGAERSLLDGSIIVPALGIDLLTGKRLTYVPVSGAGFEARVHEVRFYHPIFGTIDMEVGISTAPIRRNILGRDFFDHVQIGFREHEAIFYLTPSP